MEIYLKGHIKMEFYHSLQIFKERNLLIICNNLENKIEVDKKRAIACHL